MLPPNSFICDVTTASPIHTIEKTPEKMRSPWDLDAPMERNMLRRRQNTKGPLDVGQHFHNLGTTRRTTSPNLGVLHSFLLVGCHQHQAIYPPIHRCLSRNLPSPRVLQRPSHLPFGALHQVDIWATAPVSSSPILPASLSRQSAKHFHRWYFEALFDPRRVLRRSDSSARLVGGRTRSRCCQSKEYDQR
jgi:hypothetical protein